MRDMVTSLINTVAFLHSRDLSRDIKPDNILIGDRRELRWWTLVPRGMNTSHDMVSSARRVRRRRRDSKIFTTRVSMVLLDEIVLRGRVCVRHSCVTHSYNKTHHIYNRYDAWSLGATLLEIYIGTPHALTDPTFENALISLCLFDSYDEISRLKFILNNDNDQENKNSITVRKRCDANVFRQRLQLFDDDDDEEVDQQEQDKDHLLIDLIYRLLDPNPKSRMRIDRADHVRSH